MLTLKQLSVDNEFIEMPSVSYDFSDGLCSISDSRKDDIMEESSYRKIGMSNDIFVNKSKPLKKSSGITTMNINSRYTESDLKYHRFDNYDKEYQ